MSEFRPEPTRAERFEGRAARLLDRAPAAIRLLLSRRSRVRIDGQTLDPTLQLAAALRPQHDRGREIREHPLRARAALRRDALAFRGPSTPVGAVRDLTVEGAAGPLDARLYTPVGADCPPLLVYFHGGGFSQGDLDTHDEPCRILCREAGHVVLSVAYRLAPEHRFPAAAEDACAAFRWAQAHADALGANPARIGAGGDSAGGTLAAVAAQAFRDDRPPVGQLLIYPSTDTPTDRPSRHRFDGFFLPDASRAAYHHVYTEGTGTDERDPRLSPIYGDLAGLAPALLVTAGFDVLRDEGEAYADALREAGSPVEAYREPSLVHGFVNMTGFSRAARRATVALAHRWRALVARPAP
jgi:acetyl esterase